MKTSSVSTQARAGRVPVASSCSNGPSSALQGGPSPGADAERAFYEEHGYLGPLTAFTPDEMAEIAREVQGFARWWKLGTHRNRHLDVPVVARLCSHPAVVSRLQTLLGPDLLLWRSNIFAMAQGRTLPWHQDEYNGLLDDVTHHVSVHMAITEATEQNCLSIIPGSHRLTREQLAALGFAFVEGSDGGVYGAPRYDGGPVEPTSVTKMPLAPGQFLLFHGRMLHASWNARQIAAAKRTNKLFKGLYFGAGMLGSVFDRRHRVAIGMRVTIPAVQVLSPAFQESLPRIDRCVLLSGKNHPERNELSDWSHLLRA